MSPAPGGLALPDLGVMAAALLGAALRLVAAPEAPGTFDEVGFTAALTRFDLLSFEPHFPGYPLAVLLARAAAASGATAPYAAAASALALLAAWALHLAAGRGWGGFLAGGLVALAPPAVLVGSRATSDGVALGLLGLATAALVAARAGSPPRASALFGALLAATAAAKPDLALLLPALALAPSWRAALGGALPVAALAAASLVPGAGGVDALVAEAARFTGGHLGDWGGGVLAAAPLAGLTTPRPLLAAAPLCAALGARCGVAHVVAGVVLCALVLRAPRTARRATVVACSPYALWLLLGQNLAAPRHALPLLVPASLLAAVGLARARARPRLRAGLALALVAGAGLGAARATLEERARGRPVDALAALLAADGGGVRLYAGGEARALAWRLPGLDVRRARSVHHAREQLAADPRPPARVWVASSVPGAAALPCVRDLGAVAVFALDASGPP